MTKIPNKRIAIKITMIHMTIEFPDCFDGVKGFGGNIDVELSWIVFGSLDGLHTLQPT
jgi:hypothetical protein